MLSNDVLKILQTLLYQGPYYMPPQVEDPMTEEKGAA
jgi:hypothetical protein